MDAQWLDDHDTQLIDGERLAAEGVLYQTLALDPAAYRAPLDALKAAQGYVQEDIVALTPTMPNLDAICAKFVDEHHHDEDEVRFVLEGEGIFDIRSKDDRFMRVTVVPGDLIVVPAGRPHRFMLTEPKTIRCVRLFKDPSGWVAHYRR
jgi:1,2-dihydroxy-3-keto-5-methylthiopentene dioxygenase